MESLRFRLASAFFLTANKTKPYQELHAMRRAPVPGEYDNTDHEKPVTIENSDLTMNTNIRTSGYLRKTGWISLLLLTILVGCGKDDPDPEPYITTQQTEVSYTAVNTCVVSSGALYTRFSFKIPYKTSRNIEIEKVEYSVTWGSTVIVADAEHYTFTDNGKEITYTYCFRFNSASSVDYTSALVAKNGLKSKTAKITIDKPEGAN